MSKELKKREIDDWRYYCDICGKESRRGKCHWCNRDLCGDHALLDPTHSGDYPDRYCPDCFPVAMPLLSERATRLFEVEEEFDKKIVSAANEIRKARGLEELNWI